jgi:hypothetical protein
MSRHTSRAQQVRASKNGPEPSLATFADQLIQALHQSGEMNELRFDASKRRIIWPDKPPVNLGNLFLTYLGEPRSRRGHYVRSTARALLNSVFELPKEFDLARSNVRPGLRLRAESEHARLMDLLGDSAAESRCHLPSEPIGNHMVAHVCYVWPQITRFIDDENLAKWGVTFHEVMQVAKQNLATERVGFRKLGERSYVLITHNSYDASAFLVNGVVPSLEVLGTHVVMVPNRDTIVVTGSEDVAGLEIMADFMENRMPPPYSLSGVPLIFENSEWRDWMPPVHHPLHRRFKQIESKWLGELYAQQTELLRAVHSRQGIKIFVAGVLAKEMDNKDGDLVTSCTWTKGIESLLPVAQRVAFCKRIGEREFGIVVADWSRVIQTFGNLMELTEHYPTRYHVRVFPDESMIDAIEIGEDELAALKGRPQFEPVWIP